MPADAFVNVLRSERERLNHEFAAAERRYPELDGAAFKVFLMTSVAPLVALTAERFPTRVASLALGAYELGLELVGQGLAGPRARYPHLNAAFAELFPACIQHVSDQPLLVISSVANAVHQLATTPGARTAFWLSELGRLGRTAADVDALLRAGQILAWRAGLAHYRRGALAASDALPTELALAALGASAPVPELRDRLEKDPWFDPAQPERAPQVRFVGSFRGFGGLFPEPPSVTRSGAELLVSSGAFVWLLTADLFGATLHRATAAELANRAEPALPGELRCAEGTLHFGGCSAEVGNRGRPTSAVALEHTLAVTFEFSHEIALCALRAR